MLVFSTSDKSFCRVHRIFWWKVWNFDNTCGNARYVSFIRWEIFIARTFLREHFYGLVNRFCPVIRGQFIGLVFGLCEGGGLPNGREVTTAARKFTIISTECTRMHIRSPNASRRLKLSLPFASILLRRKLFPETFKLCYLFTEFFSYFLLRPSIESYSLERRPIIKTFSLCYPTSRTFDYPSSFDRNSCY